MCLRLPGFYICKKLQQAADIVTLRESFASHQVSFLEYPVRKKKAVCGDQIDLSLRLRDGTVDAIGFTGRGCSISQASASMLCEAVTGRSDADAQRLAEQFRAMLQGEDQGVDLGDLEALRGVRAYPVRVKCATLPWNALLQGLQGAASENGGAAHD